MTCTARQLGTHLWPVRASVSRHVPHDLRKILRILDDVDVTEHLQVRELGDDAGHPQRRDEPVVRVQVRDDLEAAVQGDDLPLDVLLEDAARSVSCGASPREEGNLRDEPDPDLLVEHLEHLLARAALEQLAVHLQALDRLATALGRPELERAVVWWVVLPRFRQLLDYMLNLRSRCQYEED